jgi:hypothetical protein
MSVNCPAGWKAGCSAILVSHRVKHFGLPRFPIYGVEIIETQSWQVVMARLMSDRTTQEVKTPHEKDGAFALESVRIMHREQQASMDLEFKLAAYVEI